MKHLTLFLVMFLAACGGGGSSTTAPVTPVSPVTPTPVEEGTTVNDAARFLMQASFGPTMPEINAVAESGLNAWIDTQLTIQSSNHRAKTLSVFSADTNAQDNGAEFPWSGHRYGAWMDIALHGQDQLRQRLAFAWSQLFVVSDKSQLEGEQYGLATYYDGLADHAFGNFRDLLEYVTLSPVMGVYLNMLGNEKPDPTNNIRPDENFAREVMQLFTIGLHELNLDGTPKLVNGQPVATYDIETVKAYAQVFTGWHFFGTTAQTWDNWWGNRNFRNPMTLVPEYHAQASEKVLLNDVVIAAGTDGETALQLALDSLFNHPNVGPFVARHLIQRLVTSNPTPAYVARVAQVFNDNGEGVRGDLTAVTKAVLLDQEARTPVVQQANSFGKIKEPLIRGIQMIRALGLYQPDTMPAQWPEYAHNQAPLSAPSVFNFYTPDFSPSGHLANLGLRAPEMEIINDTFMVRNANHAAWWSMWVPTVSEVNAGHERGMTIDYAQYTDLIGTDGSAYIDYLDTVLLAGSMTPTMRQTLLDYDEQAKQWLDAYGRVKELTFMVTGSPQFAVQR